MQNKVGVRCFFQRASESVDELVREIVDETYGVGQKIFLSDIDENLARYGIERCKKFVFRLDTRFRQKVHQR